jgi:aspartyl aminopeptidase
VTYLTEQQNIESDIIDFCRPIASIPSLAIHLDREVNNGRSINAQKDLPPLLAMADEHGKGFLRILQHQLLEQIPECEVDKILDYEMAFYDTQPGAVVGLNNEFLACSRLDNLLSCYVGIQSLLEAGDGVTAMLVCSDHEEVGSASAAGAQGPMLKTLLDRLLPNAEDQARCIERSMMISADNAHAVHPNFAEKHDENHGPKINAGPVIKINANQRYASNSETQAVFRYLAQMAEVPVQSFVVRSDMACGSTIGPITATEIGIKTLDVGVPTFGMHSIREMAGTDDAWALFQVLIGFYRQQTLWGE